MAAVMTTSTQEHRTAERRRAVPPARPALSVVRESRACPRPRAHSRAVYRRRRVAVAALALGTVVLAGRAGVALGGSTLASHERRPPLTTYVVRQGDSLWTVAQHLDPGHDPRPVVDDLAAARHGAPLVPGETIAWQP